MGGCHAWREKEHWSGISYLYNAYSCTPSGLCFRSNAVYHLELYINGLDTGISSDVSKFADDTKVARVIKSDQDAGVLRNKLDNLFDWAGKWQMEFSVGKCSMKCRQD